MGYTITGTATFTSQANRDAARTRVDTAIAAYTYTNIATAFSAGIQNPTTTTMTISIDLDGVSDTTAAACMTALYNAWTSSNRNTSGHLALNKT